MFKRIIHFILGAFSGALISGGIVYRLWSHQWGGDGVAVFCGCAVAVVTLILSALDQDGNL